MAKAVTSRVLILLAGICGTGSVMSSNAADGKCSWEVEMVNGRRVAVTSAQPDHRNGKIEFRLTPESTHWNLEVRFKPSGKQRFSSAEILKELNDPAAWPVAKLGGVGVDPQHPLKQVSVWQWQKGTYTGQYALPETIVMGMEKDWFGFDMVGMANAIRDINPSGSANTEHCSSLIQGLMRR